MLENKSSHIYTCGIFNLQRTKDGFNKPVIYLGAREIYYALWNEKIACAYTDLIKIHTPGHRERLKRSHSIVSGREHYMRGSPSEIDKKRAQRAAALELF
jgi:hypothetical protein